MIRKCALVAALREAFPGDVGGLYIPDEMGFEENAETAAPITPPNAMDATYREMDEAEEMQESVQDSFFAEEG